ncbi:MAG: hypothetical protein M1327_06955 [Candidatus Thermoplasmatota archaeon]|nr:hypothetical protein [Candidatus Thermoplasmatota archaeon]
MHRILPVCIACAVLLSSVLGYVPVPVFHSAETSSLGNFGSDSQPSSNYAYTVTFQESGLPASSFWAIQFGSSYSSSTGSSITFTSGSGSFLYFVFYGNQSSYIMQGTANVQGDTVIPINIYHFTIALSGNTRHLTWFADLHDSTGYNCVIESNGSSVMYYVSQGPYDYSVILHEFGENITLCSNTTTITDNTQLSVSMRSISFYETGIPVGNNGIPLSAIVKYIHAPGLPLKAQSEIEADSYNNSFTIFFPYNVISPVYAINVLDRNCTFQVAYGNINLSSVNESKVLSFSNISITEHNAPYGSMWGTIVYMGASKVFGFKSIYSSSNLYLLNGTYQYRYYLYSNFSGNEPTYASSDSYILTVPSVNGDLVANFSGVVDLKAIETGFSGRWEAQVTGDNISFILSGAANVLTAPVAPGSYFMNFSSFSTSLLNGSYHTVNASNSIVNISFYRLSFDQTGLSNFNANWILQLFQVGQSQSISTDYLGKTTDISFFVINGSYSYKAVAYLFPNRDYSGQPLFNSRNTTSTPLILGSNVTVNITFHPLSGLYVVHFAVQFNGPGQLFIEAFNKYLGNEIGLNFEASNTTQSVYCLFANQSIALNCGSNSFSNTSVYTVDGSNVTILLNLSWLQYSTVLFQETGLPAGTLWTVMAENQNHTSTSSKIYFTFSSREVFFSIVSIGTYDPSPDNGKIEISSRAQVINVSFISISNLSYGTVSKTLDVLNAHVYNGLFQSYPEIPVDGIIHPFYAITDTFRNLIVSPNRSASVYFLNNSAEDPSGSLYRFSPLTGSLVSLTNPESYYSVSMSSGELHLVGLSNNSSCLYVFGGNRLFLINTTSLEPVACHIIGPSGFTISCMIMDKHTGKFYSIDSMAGGIEVTALNGSNIQYITLSRLLGFGPFSAGYLVCDPNNGFLYIHYTYNRFVCLDTQNNLLGKTFAVSDCPVAATFDSQLNDLAIAGYSGEANGGYGYFLTLINVEGQGSNQNIRLGDLPTDIIFDPQNKMLYVSEITLSQRFENIGIFVSTSGHLAVIDPSQDDAVSNISIGNNPLALSETLNGTTIFVQNSGECSLVEVSLPVQASNSPSLLSHTFLSGIIITGSLIAGVVVGYFWIYRKRRS